MSQIQTYIKESKRNANEHGWLIKWSNDNCISENYKIISIGEALCLCHSELSEALEAFRKDDFEHFKEEIADEFIRLFHLCGDLDINIENEIKIKMNKNKNRPKYHGKKNL